MGTSIMITSGKGGTGKTSLTAGVSACLAALGQRVLCVDLDIGLRNLDLSLGLSDRALMDFRDVMECHATLSTAAVEHPDIQGLYLLTAPLSLEHLNQADFRRLIAEAKDCFDFVLMDSPAGLGEGFQLAMAAADRVIVVSATEPAALRDAQRAISQLIGRIPELHLVVNRVQPKLMDKLRTSIDNAMDMAGLPLLGVVPEDSQVILAANTGEPLILFSRKGAALAYLNIAKRLMGQRVPLMKIR